MNLKIIKPDKKREYTLYKSTYIKPSDRQTNLYDRKQISYCLNIEAEQHKGRITKEYKETLQGGVIFSLFLLWLLFYGCTYVSEQIKQYT